MLSFGTLGYSQTWEVGGFAGGSGYLGDLNPVGVYKFTDLAFGGQVKRNFNGYWSLKLSALHGTMRANDAHSQDPQQRLRNLSFFSPLNEVSLQVEYNFFRYIPSISPKRYTPYLFAGVGRLKFNPKTHYEGNVYQLALYSTEDLPYKTSAMAVPYGVGMKFNFAGKWSLISELGYRTAFSDYLDDVSGRYPSPSFFPISSTINDPAIQNIKEALSDRSVGQIATPGSQRGDFRKRDSYMFTGVTLTYTFISQKCPVVK